MSRSLKPRSSICSSRHDPVLAASLEFSISGLRSFQDSQVPCCSSGTWHKHFRHPKSVRRLTLLVVSCSAMAGKSRFLFALIQRAPLHSSVAEHERSAGLRSPDRAVLTDMLVSSLVRGRQSTLVMVGCPSHMHIEESMTQCACLPCTAPNEHSIHSALPAPRARALHSSNRLAAPA